MQPNQLVPVDMHHGGVLPPNTTEDGHGCIVFRDRIPTGTEVAPLEEQPSLGDCCRRCREEKRCNVFTYCPLEVGVLGKGTGWGKSGGGRVLP